MSEEERQETTAAVPVTAANTQLVDMGLLRATTPGQMIEAAATIATPLADIIEKRQLFTVLGKKRHVHYEGWSTMLAMLGVVAIENYALRHKEEEEGAGAWYEAYVDLKRMSDGQVVGGAEAGTVLCFSRRLL